jgi:hypothetical protein
VSLARRINRRYAYRKIALPGLAAPKDRRKAAARPLAMSRTAAEPGWRTTASLDDIASPNTAEAPRMLSRPIIANSIVCPSDKRTIIEMMPLSGRYR